MKNILLTILFALSPLFSFAQEYDFGSAIMFPGNKIGTVFYIDDTGEHGIAISGECKFTVKNAEERKKKARKLGLNHDQIYDDNSLPRPTEEISKKDLIKVYKEIIPNLSDDGEKNMTAITEYCEKQGISMQNYFPEHYWAKSLGEGWYIPGTKELELLAKLIIGGTGEKYYFKDLNSSLNRGAEVCNGEITLLSGLIIHVLTDGIKTSTMKNAKNGFYALLPIVNNKKSYRKWLELQDIGTNNALIVAVHKF